MEGRKQPLDYVQENVKGKIAPKDKIIKISINKIIKEDEICKLIKAFPKDIAALDKRSVLAKVNSQGSGT